MPSPADSSSPADPAAIAAAQTLARREAENSSVVEAAAAAEQAAAGESAAVPAAGGWQAVPAAAKIPPTEAETAAAELSAETSSPADYRPLQVTPNSNVAAAAYSAKTMQLLVTFHRDDRQFVYSGVTADVVAAMERAEDTGKFFYWKIRTAFPYEEVT